MRTVLLLLLLSLPLLAPAAEPVRAVATLDLARYAGTWHNIAHLPMFFQRQCVSDTTATYTAREDGLIGVRNTCRNKKGETEVADGVARPVAGQPGQLEVRFAPDWLAFLPMVWADYWVLDVDTDYRWALVGEPDRKYLWILSREPGMDRALFERLKARAVAMGYDLQPLIMDAPLRD